MNAAEFDLLQKSCFLKVFSGDILPSPQEPSPKPQPTLTPPPTVASSPTSKPSTPSSVVKFDRETFTPLTSKPYKIKGGKLCQVKRFSEVYFDKKKNLEQIVDRIKGKFVVYKPLAKSIGKVKKTKPTKQPARPRGRPRKIQSLPCVV